MRILLASCLLSLSRLAAAAPLFLNILPAGQDGLVATVANDTTHELDQLPLYRDLITRAPGLTDALVLDFFKDASIAAPATPERTETPRPGCTIQRDRFGVPHIQGTTRSDVFFGAGYATAEDRLFLADVLRHIGRGRASEFLGRVQLDFALDFDRTYAAVAGYSEEELQQQIDDGLAADPVLGGVVLQDAIDFVAGLNQYIAEARLDAAKRPIEYVALALPLDDWTVRDVVACTITFVTVIGFGNGGGGEHRNSDTLQKLQARLGAKKGQLLFRDLRFADDPEAPSTSSQSAPYLQTAGGDPAAVAMLDADSFVPAIQIATSAGGSFAPAAAPFPHGMSNWLAINADRTADGAPILVGGPQTGYFSPQVMIELSLDGGGIAARGAAVPGTPYVVLGHTPDFAFSATAGGSDLADVRVERLCTPPGGIPNGGTLYNGSCRPMSRRVDRWMAGTQPVTRTIERTVHGPVIGRATVAGVPVVLAVERSSFMKEIRSGGAFAFLNDNSANTPALFRDALARSNSTLNWIFASKTDTAYFHSGLYPVRAPGVDPDLPSWGTGEWEWQGFLPPTQHPFEQNPARGFMTSWNNKPAPGWRANDRNFGYGPLYRSQMLDVRLTKTLAAGPVTVAGAVDAMADAATVDFRGQELLPWALKLAKGDRRLAPAINLLAAWLASGAHRLDRDGNGAYDDEAAVALMDAWYGPLVHAAFDPSLGARRGKPAVYDTVPLRFDDRPGSVGSAYQDGYYGYLHRALRQALGRKVPGRFKILRCADGSRAGCARAVRKSLRAAVAELATKFGSSDPAQWHYDARADDIEFTAGGALAPITMPWQNRPTFQQVVQIRP